MRTCALLFLALLFLAPLFSQACKPPRPAPTTGSEGCAFDLTLPPDLVTPGSTLLLGETHGTREVPEFAADLACHVLAQGQPLVLALEIAATEQPRIDRFLESAGDEAARAEFLSGEFWTFPMQDGRRSKATVDLLATVQRWKREQAPIEVVAFDAEVPPAERDAAMAAQLAQARLARPEAVFVVVTGSLHAMRASTPNFEPMAVLYESLVAPSRVVALRLVHAGGSAWLCTEECGPHQLKGRGSPNRSFNLFEHITDGFDGEFYVGPIHASPPATAPLRTRATPN